MNIYVFADGPVVAVVTADSVEDAAKLIVTKHKQDPEEYDDLEWFWVRCDHNRAGDDATILEVIASKLYDFYPTENSQEVVVVNTG